MCGTLVAVLLAVVHDQSLERATDSALHGRVELRLKAAVETTERVPGVGIFLANNIVGQFVVFNEHEAIVGSNPQSGRACGLRSCLSCGSILGYPPGFTCTLLAPRGII
jgi:hypothetical protein